MAMYHGYCRRETDKRNEYIYLAWHTAALSRQKTLPSLSSLLARDEEPAQQKEQTPEQMFAMCRLLNAAFGGEEVVVDGGPV